MNEHDTLVYLKGYLERNEYITDAQLRVVKAAIDEALSFRSTTSFGSTGSLISRSRLDEIASLPLPGTPPEYYNQPNLRPSITLTNPSDRIYSVNPIPTPLVERGLTGVELP